VIRESKGREMQASPISDVKSEDSDMTDPADDRDLLFGWVKELVTDHDDPFAPA